jgi:hypothetical protein
MVRRIPVFLALLLIAGAAVYYLGNAAKINPNEHQLPISHNILHEPPTGPSPGPDGGDADLSAPDLRIPIVVSPSKKVHIVLPKPLLDNHVIITSLGWTRISMTDAALHVTFQLETSAGKLLTYLPANTTIQAYAHNAGITMPMNFNGMSSAVNPDARNSDFTVDFPNIDPSCKVVHISLTGNHFTPIATPGIPGFTGIAPALSRPSQVDADIPIAGLPYPVSSFTVTGSDSITVNNVTYSYQHFVGHHGFNSGNLFWVKPQSNVVFVGSISACRLSAGPSPKLALAGRQLGTRWHIDGTPAGSNETGIFADAAIPGPQTLVFFIRSKSGDTNLIAVGPNYRLSAIQKTSKNAGLFSGDIAEVPVQGGMSASDIRSQFINRTMQDLNSITSLPSPVVSLKADGMHVVVDGAQWTQSPFGVGDSFLRLRLKIVKNNGQPAFFADPRDAVTVSVKQDPNDFNGYQRMVPASIAPDLSKWTVQLPNIDPRLPVLPLTFSLRDPALKEQETGQADSEIEYDGIVVTSAAKQDISKTFTTKMGTKLTISSFSLPTKDPYNRSAINLKISTKNTKFPDVQCNASIQITDSVNRILAMGQYNNANHWPPQSWIYGQNRTRVVDHYAAPRAATPDDPGEVPCNLTGGEDIKSSGPINIRLQVMEISQRQMAAVKHTNLEAQLPLSTIPRPDAYMVSGNSTLSANGVTIEHQQASASFATGGGTTELLWIHSSDPRTHWHISALGPTQSPNGFSPMAQLRDVEAAYWHPDSTPLKPGEHGVSFTSGSQAPSQTVTLVLQSSIDDQRQVSFNNIRIPNINQSYVANQPGNSDSQLLLKSVMNRAVDKNVQASGFAEHVNSFLSLTFSSANQANDPMWLTINSAKDDNNRQIFAQTGRFSANNIWYQGPQQGGPRPIFVLVPLTSSDAVSFSFTGTLTEQHQPTPPIVIQIDSNGKMKKINQPSGSGVQNFGVSF